MGVDPRVDERVTELVDDELQGLLGNLQGPALRVGGLGHDGEHLHSAVGKQYVHAVTAGPRQQAGDEPERSACRDSKPRAVPRKVRFAGESGAVGLFDPLPRVGRWCGPWCLPPSGSGATILEVGK